MCSRNQTKSMALLLLGLMLSVNLYSQQLTQEDSLKRMEAEWQKMNASKDASREWFRSAKFGMFIHWGLYAIPAGVWHGKRIHDMRDPHIAEWLMYSAEIPRNEYAALAKQFNPTAFDAEAIVSLAKAAGMKYIVITSKHHDGFALFDSKVSTYDVMDATPFKRDIIKELHDACQKQGIAFGVYYSQNLDWYDGTDDRAAYTIKHHPEYPEWRKTLGANTWDPSPNTFEEYLQQKAYPQVKELMTQYPGMKMLWYDMPYRLKEEESFEFYKIPYEIQPQILINERVGFDFGDYTIPGDNTIPEAYAHLTKPWETVGTFNNSWGYNSYDNDWKSPEEVLYWLVEIVSKGGNYMLNIGPTGKGEVPAPSVNSLQTIGRWLAVNGEAIYDTQPWKIAKEGPSNLIFHGTEDREARGFQNNFTAQDFWFTQKDHRVFAISLGHGKERNIIIRSLPKKEYKVKEVKLLGASTPLSWQQKADGLQVTLPETLPGELGYALEITLK